MSGCETSCNSLKDMLQQFYGLTFFHEIHLACLYFKSFQKQPPVVFFKKRCSQNFAKFAGKHLCQNLFFNKVAVTFFAEQNRLLLPFLAIICKCFRKINLNFHGKSVPYLANNFMFKGNRNTRQAYEISSKLSTLNIFCTFVCFLY